MSKFYYLKNTINNLDSWLDGFMCFLHDSDDDDMPITFHQMLILYERQLTEIVEHAKSLIKDIEEGDISET